MARYGPLLGIFMIVIGIAAELAMLGSASQTLAKHHLLLLGGVGFFFAGQHAGGSGAFEVFLDEKLIFSKLNVGRWPKVDEITENVRLELKKR